MSDKKGHLVEELISNNGLDYRENKSESFIADNYYITEISPSFLHGGYQTFPQVETSLRKNGYLHLTEVNYFYDTFYFSPEEIAIPDLTQPKTYSISVWNAHFTYERLQSVTVQESDGIIVQNLNNPVFAPLETKYVTLYIPASAKGNINAVIEFKFTNGETYTISVSAKSTNFFTYIPEHNWSETFIFKTEISQSISRELRARIGNKPNREFQYTYKFTDKQLSKFSESMRNGQTKTWFVPMWEQLDSVLDINIGKLQYQKSPERIGYKTRGYAMLYKDDDNLLTSEIKAVSGDNITLNDALHFNADHALFMPMRLCYLMDTVGIGRDWYNGLSSGQIKFTEYNTEIPNTPINYPVLGDWYVFDTPTDKSAWATGQKVVFINDTQGEPVIHTQQDRSLHQHSANIHINTREAYHHLLAWINYLGGQYKSFWSPDWGRLLHLTRNMLAGSGFVAVHDYVGIDDWSKFALRIEVNKKVYYFKLIEMLSSDSEFRLVIDGVLPIDIYTTDNYSICLMRRMRLSEDEVTIEHNNFTDMKCTLNMVEIL